MTSHLQVNERVDLTDSNIYEIEEVVEAVSKTTNYLNLQSNMLTKLSISLNAFTKLTVLDMRYAIDQWMDGVVSNV